MQNSNKLNWDDIKIFLELARTERLAQAAKKLGIDPSTVSRRLHRLEDNLATQLFERGTDGHVLTEHGRLLLKEAQSIEQRTLAATDLLAGRNLQPRGRVRLGVTEAFGNYVIGPQLARFCQTEAEISIDLLPLQRFVKWATHEVDIAITIERPDNRSLVVTKLCDYRLQLYASRRFLAQHAPITKLEEAARHPLIGYVDELVFSDQLSYMERLFPNCESQFRSTSVISQFAAVREGLGLGILPCFLAHADPDLCPLLTEEGTLLRTFWMAVPLEQKKLARVSRVWEFLKQVALENHDLLMGYPDHGSKV